MFRSERAPSGRLAFAPSPHEPIAAASHEPGPGRWSRERVVWLIVAVFVLCGGLVVASLTAHGTDAEGEVRQLVAAARTRWEQHDFHRESAREPGIVGNAFDAYREAIALAATLPPKLIARAEQVANDRTLLRAEDEAGIAAFDPAIARLRHGAQRQDARQQLDWSSANQCWLDPLVWVPLLRVALLRLDRTPGPGEQTALTLDLASCCGDLLGSPSLVEQMVGSLGLEGVITHWTDERIGAAGPGDRRALAEALRTLDARTSPVPPWLGLEAAVLAAGKDPAAVLPITRWQACLAAWRTGFSSRRMMIDAITETMTSLAEVSVEPDEAWPARTARLSAIDRRLRGSENLATRMMAVGVRDVEFERRKTLCRLRLLRLALAWHEGSTLPPLPDPFARDALRVVANGATAEFTSAHADRELCRTSTRP